METLVKYANFEDIISAFELVYGVDMEEDKNSTIFNVYDILAILNFGCIQDSDKVITITSQYELINWAVAYQYTPGKLDAYILDRHREYDLGSWHDMKQLLWGYHYTEPKVSLIDMDAMNTRSPNADRRITHLEYSDEYYDKAIIGTINFKHETSDYIENRFYLDEGNDFDLYETLLVKSCKALKTGGILVLLTKPAWILKLWPLLDELGLHLEYDSYKVYKDLRRHPNVFVGLRLVKKDKGTSMMLHKKNILAFMEENEIDRLYAHRNNLLYPYVELTNHNAKAYVEMNQNLEYLQYFFTVETTKQLADLCVGYTACLVTPSVAQYAYKAGKTPILFERDNRFRENGGCKFVKYDLNTGLTKLMQNRYQSKFDRVICDPPFDIHLEVLARDIDELLIKREGSIAYVVFPEKRKNSLVNAMKTKGFSLNQTEEHLCIEYARPPKLVRMNGKDAIQLYKFTYDNDY